MWWAILIYDYVQIICFQYMKYQWDVCEKVLVYDWNFVITVSADDLEMSGTRILMAAVMSKGSIRG